MGGERKTVESSVDTFLRLLSVNVLGGAVWAVLMAYIHPIQARLEPQLENIALLLLAGAVVGGIFSIGGFLIPWAKKGKGLKKTLYDILYGLASVYTTAALVFLLTALVLAFSGGFLPIKGDGGVDMRDLLNALSLDYLVQLGLMPVIGSLIVTFLDLAKIGLWKSLKSELNLRRKTLDGKPN